MIEFTPLPYPQEWHDHYEKPTGFVYVYHASASNRITIQAYKKGYYLTAEVIPSRDVEALAKCINKIKAYNSVSHQPGGSFAINELGCVIVPVAGISTKFFVGTLRGRLQFTCSAIDFGLPFDLSGDGLQEGELWPYPYIGMKYHISARGNLYKIIQNDDKENIRYSHEDNEAIIKAVRRVRQWSYGPVSFLVTADGAVLVKKTRPRQHLGSLLRAKNCISRLVLTFSSYERYWQTPGHIWWQ